MRAKSSLDSPLRSLRSLVLQAGEGQRGGRETSEQGSERWWCWVGHLVRRCLGMQLQVLVCCATCQPAR